ncbi:MAG TPA: DUF4440 domain-containing protein [Thermoanaerobaculia bacterium]|nr:DUF4440 domain-containing protein [Thermoanaerobaculia bacterium]
MVPGWIALGWLLSSMGAAAPAPAADAGAELRRLTEQRFAANAESDRGFYERLLAPSAVVLLPFRPPQTRQEYLEEEFGHRPPGFRGEKGTVEGFRALVEGDTAVVSYAASEPTELGELTFESRTYRVDTYIRQGGAWRLLSMAVTPQPSWPKPATVDAKLYEDYAGTYQISPSLQAVVTVEGGRLFEEVTGQPKVELFPESATLFFDKTDSPLARTLFERDGTGKVVTQVYVANGLRMPARKVK